MPSVREIVSQLEHRPEDCVLVDSEYGPAIALRGLGACIATDGVGMWRGDRDSFHGTLFSSFDRVAVRRAAAKFMVERGYVL